jgi:phosphoadenosine phosphosulfate reductase
VDDPGPGNLAQVSPPPELPDFEGASAEEVLTWAFGEFFPDITVASSLQDTVLIDLAWRVEPRVQVFFLETGFHFEETLETADQVRSRYNIELVKVEPISAPRIWSEDGYAACCEDRKVIPMNNFLKGKRAWVTGLRRVEAPTRSGAKAVEWDEARGMVKINPIVDWSHEQVQSYIKEHDLIVNPLVAEGYESIGCAPCTVPGKGREGRWAGNGKIECGIHVSLPLTVVTTPSEQR